MSHPRLSQFFKENPKVALAFSGGVDSTFLLYSGLENGADIRPYFVKTVFQPISELEDAKTLASEMGTGLTVLDLDITSDENLMRNPEDRCYICKRRIFSELGLRSKQDGYPLLIDGTNASDMESERPGMKALREFSVASPLRLCDITKDDIRILSKEAGLQTWSKPSYSCLATRIPSGREITCDDLARVERSERTIRAMGFMEFRVKLDKDGAILRFSKAELDKAESMLDDIIINISDDYDKVTLDRNPR